MTFGSRAKGARAEREVAALLQQWWRAVEPGAIFRRVPLSGGWGGSAEARRGFKASGDVCTTAAKFPFSVEVKNRARWSFDAFLAGKRSPVWSWWRQALAQAEEASLVPSLWFRRNREPWRVLLPLDYALEKFPSEWACSMSEPIQVMNTDIGARWVERSWHGGTRPAMVVATSLLAMDPREFTRREDE